MKNEVMRGGVELDGHLQMLAMEVNSSSTIANGKSFSLHEYCAHASVGHSLCGKIASLAQGGSITDMNAMQDEYISKLIV
jgi:hypothetical protein